MTRPVRLLITLAALTSCTSAQTASPPEGEGAVATAITTDPYVWLTLEETALAPINEAFAAARSEQAMVGLAKNGITTLRVRQSQVSAISRVMHERFRRCAGFEAHGSEAEAQRALEPVSAELQRAVAYSLDNGPAVEKLISTLVGSNVLATLNTLAAYKTRYYTSTTGVDASNWVKTQWETMAQGRTDVTVTQFKHSWPQPSVIATITGTSAPNEVVIIGAHVDSLNQRDTTSVAPGADDDASGVATITEAFRAVMASGFKPARTVKFIAYAGEEAGLLGSKEIAAKHKSDGIDVIGVLQLDMTNFKGSASDIYFVTDYTDAQQNAFMGQLVDTYARVSKGETRCGYGCSDHAPWHRQGFRASFPTEATIAESSPYLHTPQDILANTGGTVDHSMKFARLTVAYVGELAKGSFTIRRDGTPPTVVITGPAADTTVSGRLSITANATDNVSVSRVVFTIDGVNVGTDSAAPYEVTVDTAALSVGAHVISATAYDTSRNSAVSGPVSVVVTR